MVLNLLFSFFNRCASSTTKYCQLNRFSAPFSDKHISYVVRHVSHSVRCCIVFMTSARAVFSPIKIIGFIVGQNRLTSLYQLRSVDFGPTTKNGPSIFLQWQNNVFYICLSTYRQMVSFQFQIMRLAHL